MALERKGILAGFRRGVPVTANWTDWPMTVLESAARVPRDARS